jgi:hypothetical protein
MRSARRHFIAIAAVAAAAAGLADGCGSSKPAYCGDLTKLEQSVKSINPTKGLSALKTQVQDVQTNATSLISSAKSDFPNETSAISTSIGSLKTSVEAAASSPSASALATVATDAKSVLDSVTSFQSASKSKCS